MKNGLNPEGLRPCFKKTDPGSARFFREVLFHVGAFAVATAEIHFFGVGHDELILSRRRFAAEWAFLWSFVFSGNLLEIALWAVTTAKVNRFAVMNQLVVGAGWLATQRAIPWAGIADFEFVLFIERVGTVPAAEISHFGFHMKQRLTFRCWLAADWALV